MAALLPDDCCGAHCCGKEGVLVEGMERGGGRKVEPGGGVGDAKRQGKLKMERGKTYGGGRGSGERGGGSKREAH